MIEVQPMYESWNLDAFRLPPRSHLYSLQPAGMGTEVIESLTSYVARLAEIHRVSVRRLLSEKILLLIKPPTPLKDQLQAAQTWLGATPGVIKAVGCLQRLTLRQDLQNLTLLPWQKQLPTTAVFHPAQPFCPVCYEEARNAEAEVYEPLLWTLAAVNVCLRHHRYLYLWCPYCGGKQPFLRLEARPGYCSNCRVWLGMELPPFVATEPEEFDWHVRLTQTLGQRLQSALFSIAESSFQTQRSRQVRKPSLMSLLECRYELDESESAL